ncbi:MAG: imidazole glycerol phosphate synthase subunit HisH [Proteobacteria bacterium]|nr:imidazole glycerol phosphate synthase subunit HisH [Pseudomonadota bacterium]
MTVVIVDYGRAGNLRSVASLFERAAATGGSGARIVVSGEAEAVRAADRIVLPGQGAFGDCKSGLAARPGLIEALFEAVIDRGRPFLGICVGMQLTATRGLEHGEHEGFGWIPGEVVRLAPAGDGLGGRPYKVPHMGWNELDLCAPDHALLAGIASGAHMYFVHSYHLRCEDDADVLATTDYGGPVTAMVARGNVAGVEFHPEKSQAVIDDDAGLRLIANFFAWKP